MYNRLAAYLALSIAVPELFRLIVFKKCVIRLIMPSKCHRAIGFAFAKSYAWKIRQVSLANSHMTRFLQKFFPCFSATVAAISEISTVLRTALPRVQSPRSIPCQIRIVDLHSWPSNFGAWKWRSRSWSWQGIVRGDCARGTALLKTVEISEIAATVAEKEAKIYFLTLIMTFTVIQGQI